MNRVGILFYQTYVLTGLLAGRTVRLAAKQTVLADSKEVWGKESDRGRFGCLSCQ